jgi:hypothetical protein
MAADPDLRGIPVIVVSSLPEATIRVQAEAAAMILDPAVDACAFRPNRRKAWR